MIRLLTILLIYLFAFGAVQGQEYRFSKAEKLSNKVTDFDIIGKVGENVILHKYGNNYNVIEAYDAKTMQRTWIRELNLDGKKTGVLDIIPLADGLLVFYFKRQKSTVFVLARKYNSQMQSIGDAVELANFPRGFTSSSFDLDLISDDQNRYFGILRKVNGSMGYKEVNLMVVNRSFETLLPQTTILLENNTRFAGALMNPDGSLIVMTAEMRRSLFSGPTSFEGINAVVYPKDGRASVNITLDPGSNRFGNFAVEWDQLNKQLVFGGYYSSEHGSDLRGFFTAACSIENSKTISAQYGYFDEAAAAKVVREKQPTGKSNLPNKYNQKYFKSRFQDIELRKLIVRSDGGVLLVGESTRIVDNANDRDPFFDNRFQNSLRNPREYFYDDVLALSIEPDGQLEWVQILPKQQYSQDDQGYYSSVGVMNDRDKIRLLFNETLSQRMLNEFVLSSSGQFRIRSLLKTKELKIRTAARYAKQISSSEIVIPSFEDNDKMSLLLFRY